ncbi:MAG TPA: helix-turn-helix domain-containing protein [Streptosporangiaceae bacterium]|jgi:polyketide synthase 12
MNQPVTWAAPPAERADAAQGADKLTMDGLAERVGLGKGTVFRRFRTWAGIFQALLDDDESDFQQQVVCRGRQSRPSVAAVENRQMSGRAVGGMGAGSAVVPIR